MAAGNSSIRIRDYLRNAKRIDLDDAAALIEAWAASRNDPETLADVARARNVVGFVRRVLDEADGLDPPAPELMAALALRRRNLRLPVETLLDVFDDVRRELARSGIPTLLLKGLSFGERLYGSLEHRPQFDVDVLVRRRQLRGAVRALLRSGFAKSDYDMHSRTLVRNGIKVDVHGSLRWAPAYRLNEDDLWADVREVTIAGRPVPTLSDEHTVLMLIVSSFEDVGQGTAKLKQLLDFYLFLRKVDETSDWEGFLRRRAEENLLGVSVNVLALVLDAFGARDAVPRLAAALGPHSDRIVLADRAAALALIAAPRKASTCLAWFARVYPGSLAHYLAWFWAGGFPANLRHVGRAWDQLLDRRS